MEPKETTQRNRHLRRLIYMEPLKPVGKQSKKVSEEKQDYDFLDYLSETDKMNKTNNLYQAVSKNNRLSIPESTQIGDVEDLRKQEEEVVVPISLSSQVVEKSLLTIFLKNKIICSYHSLRTNLARQEADVSQGAEDFVLFGCIWEKVSVREGKHGSKLCDMQGRYSNLLTMILTRQACDTFWKELPGTVLMIISPRILKPRSHGDGCAIQVEKTKQIWVLGKAEYYGFCSAVRKDGAICGACIDTRFGNRCGYHESLNIKSKTSTKRPELNSVPVGSALHPRKYMRPVRCQNISKGAFNVSFGSKNDSILLNNMERSKNVNFSQTECSAVFQSSAFHNGRHSHGMRYLNNMKTKRMIPSQNKVVVGSVSTRLAQNVEQSIELTDDEE
ncbi:DNA replication licensing factor mcm10 [Galdieria sulphuraria]|nr:DNA replication licensing factor mcm10 [Galdieria sulphuraria]